MIIVILSTLFAALALYVFIATLLCCEINDEQRHWWCPLCQLCKLALRRFV